MDIMAGPSITYICQMDVETSLIGLGIFALLALIVAHATNSIGFDGVGLSPYLQFIYANFIKSHKGKADSGQQSALESFYAAQVSHEALRKGTCQLSSARQASMTQPESASYAAVRTCLRWCPPN